MRGGSYLTEEEEGLTRGGGGGSFERRRKRDFHNLAADRQIDHMCHKSLISC